MEIEEEIWKIIKRISNAEICTTPNMIIKALEYGFKPKEDEFGQLFIVFGDGTEVWTTPTCYDIFLNVLGMIKQKYYDKLNPQSK